MSDSKDMHINESILSDEIREDLKKNRTNHMAVSYTHLTLPTIA